MTDDSRRDDIPDAVDPITQQQAADDQQREQLALEEEARRRLDDDAGDPKDRLPDFQEDRLMQQETYRELHP